MTPSDGFHPVYHLSCREWGRLAWGLLTVAANPIGSVRWWECQYRLWRLGPHLARHGYWDWNDDYRWVTRNFKRRNLMICSQAVNFTRWFDHLPYDVNLYTDEDAQLRLLYFSWPMKLEFGKPFPWFRSDSRTHERNNHPAASWFSKVRFNAI